jgi:hypothetical protein
MTDEKKEGMEEEFEIIEAPEGSAPQQDQGAEPKEEDERLRQSDEDEDEDDTSGNEQETPEQRAERRREERRRRKERQRRAEAETKAELQRQRELNEFMAAKLQQLEAVTLRNEARAVDQRMHEAKLRYAYAERAHEEAIARGDGIGATKALRERDQAASEFREAEHLRSRLIETGREPQREQAKPRGPDPRVAAKAKGFIEKHSWIDPTGERDEDSAVARAIDIKLQSDGYDPASDEYWERLEERLKERLPHRFKQSGGRQAPPVAGGIDRAGSGKKPFYLSPDRKKAMQDAGIWDDPVQRQKMIKRYAEYDAQQKTKATR